MAQLLVRNIDDATKESLKMRARQHGWSMEEEVRQILLQAVNAPAASSAGLGSKIAGRFSGIGLSQPLPTWPEQSIEPMVLDS